MENVQTRPIDDQISEYMNYCQFIRQMSPMTITSKRSTYKYFVRDIGIDDLTKLDNAAFNKWIQSQSNMGVSARTINVRMAHVLSMLRYFREMGMNMPIKLPLIRKLREAPARRTFYTREQIDKALNAADDLGWLLIKIAFDTGLRISEIRNMRMENIFGRRIKFVGKGRKDRESYMSKEARERLDKWIADNGVDDYIWLNQVGRPYSVCEIRIRMRKPFQDVGFTDFYPHSLRHSFGSDIQRQGATLMEIQQMMGHSNAETTQRYLHGLDGRLESFFLKYKDKELVEA